MKNWGSNTEEWSNVGGCSLKHPFNADKRADCEEAYASKNPKSLQAQSDLILAQAAAMHAGKAQGDTGWTALQTGLVIGGSMLAIGLMVLIIKKAKK